MLITVQTDEAMSTTSLPDEVRGAFWIEDARGQQLMFADANDGQWRMTLASGLMFCPPSAEGGLDVLLIKRASSPSKGSFAVGP